MTTNTTDDVLCLCAICREDCVRGQELADFFVFERFNPSELKYIEIAHASCVRASGQPIVDGVNIFRGKGWEL